MTVLTHRNFDKMYAKLPKKIQEHFKERRNLFLKNQFHSLLDNHPLTAEYAGCRSINVTGSYRAIFHHEEKSVVRFLAIGTHSELYE